MMLFIPPKKKLLELGLLLILTPIFYFIYPSFDALILFVFGFIWNWSASNDLTELFEINKRYRFSTLKLVINLQNLFVRPFARAPELVQRFIKILPAGTFWFMVIYINDSVMPWWATFLGSLAFELMQLEMKLFKSHKEKTL